MFSDRGMITLVITLGFCHANDKTPMLRLIIPRSEAAAILGKENDIARNEHGMTSVSFLENHLKISDLAVEEACE